MLNLITPAALSCVLFAAPQSTQPTKGPRTPPGMSADLVEQILSSGMEKHVRYSVFTPEHVNAAQLADYASQLSASKTNFHTIDAEGVLRGGSRPRFLPLRDSIAVQDFPGRLEEGLTLLADLDLSLGEKLSRDSYRPIVATHELSRISQKAAARLLFATFPSIAVMEIPESNVLTMKGEKKEVEAAKAILKSADQPYPQVMLTWTLYEATDSAGNDAAPADIASALAPVVPGKEFRRAGAFIVRGAAGGNASLHVSSGLKGLGGMSDDLPSEISLTAVASGWDKDSQTLNLSNCEIVLQRSRYVTQESPGGVKSRSTTLSTDQLQTQLSLKAGETTVVGSMGGDPVFVALTLKVL